jgi:hypothetical protein
LKTREEVEELKASWNSDPCWDLWDTEGFEHYRDELLEYSQKCEKEWNAAYEKKLLDKADAIGVPGNKQLAIYILGLEDTIEKLGDVIQMHLNRH